MVIEVFILFLLLLFFLSIQIWKNKLKTGDTFFFVLSSENYSHLSSKLKFLIVYFLSCMFCCSTKGLAKNDMFYS
jgi:hypothetical protein